MKKNINKNIIIVIVFIILLAILFFSIKSINKGGNIIKKIEGINYFNLSYTRGYMANADIRYTIECKDKCVLTFKPLYVPQEESITVELSDEEINKVVEIINKYDVFKWDGFNKSDNNVLDGDSFYLTIIDNNGNKMSASGYMKYPDNYGSFESEINSLFEGYKEENK